MNTKVLEESGFELKQQLSSTSNSIVWEAIQSSLDRKVIIRALNEEAAAESREVENFLTMARNFARLKSESLAGIFDIVSQGNYHYVVMEHVEGQSLKQYLESHGVFSVQQALKMALALANSLDVMWQSAGIVYRNFNYAQIRITSRGLPKLTDFSMALDGSIGVGGSRDEVEILHDAIQFVAPEQIQGTDRLTTQADMYGLGALLYQLTTGRMPFGKLGDEEAIEAHRISAALPPHRLNPALPLNFSWFIHKLMMKNPNNRYANWGEVAADIKVILDGGTPSCVSPEEEFLSSIDLAPLVEDWRVAEAAALADEASKPPTRRFRVKAKRLAAYQGKQILDDHESETKRDNRWREILCWSLLGFWLLGLLWFRAVYQSEGGDDTVADAELVQPGAGDDYGSVASSESLGAPAQVGAVPDAADTVPALESETVGAKDQASDQVVVSDDSDRGGVKVRPEPGKAGEVEIKPSDEDESQAAGIPPVLQLQMIKAFAKGELKAVRHEVSSTTLRFRERKALIELLEAAQEPDEYLATQLKGQIGRVIMIQHQGKPRAVVPRKVSSDSVTVEANGREVLLPFTALPPDTRLLMLDLPQTPAQALSYSMILMQTERKGEVSGFARRCPLLQSIIMQAAELAASEM